MKGALHETFWNIPNVSKSFADHLVGHIIFYTYDFVQQKTFYGIKLHKVKLLARNDMFKDIQATDRRCFLKLSDFFQKVLCKLCLWDRLLFDFIIPQVDEYSTGQRMGKLAPNTSLSVTKPKWVHRWSASPSNLYPLDKKATGQELITYDVLNVSAREVLVFEVDLPSRFPCSGVLPLPCW